MSGITKLMTAGGGGVNLTPASSIASDVTVNVPVVDCTLLSNKTAGTVLQVVQGTFSTSVSTSSSSYVDTGLSASITPTSASNKILARFSGNVVAGVSGSDASMYFNIVRNSTQITYNTHRTYDYGGNGVYAATNDSLEILDSPASTSLLTYKVQIKLASGSAAWLQNDAGYATLTLMEIAA